MTIIFKCLQFLNIDKDKNNVKAFVKYPNHRKNQTTSKPIFVPEECTVAAQYLPQAPTAINAATNTTNRMRQITSVQLLYIAKIHRHGLRKCSDRRECAVHSTTCLNE